MPPRTPILLLLSALAFAACSEVDAAAPRPDVVLVVCDTLRSDRLSCYGYPRATSPVIDALAARGTLCEDVTCQWPWTLPSMVSLFQGEYVTAYRDALDPEAIALPEMFKAAGYRTIGIVANCIVDDSQGFSRGFDHFDCLSCWDEQGEKDPSARDIQEVRRLVAESVRDLLGSAGDGPRAPLFVYVHAYDPHDPYSPHDEYAPELPPRESVPVQPEGYWEDTLEGLQPVPIPGDREQALSDLRNARGRYDQEVRYFDAGLGEILSDLRGLGVGDNAVFALVSDHGEGLWAHLANEPVERFAKMPPKRVFYQIHGGNGYQPVMATPFVLWGTGVPSGLRITAPVENVDLYPTLLELADIAPPPGLDGRSLVPLFAGPAESWREYVYCYGSQASTVRHVESGFKLIIPSGKSVKNGRDLELYNLHDDPHERVNLAGDHPEHVRGLIEQYELWLDENPAVSTTTLRGHADQQDRDRKLLEQKLQSLGYTELETGRPEEN